MPILTPRGTYCTVLNLLRHPGFLPLHLQMNHTEAVGCTINYSSVPEVFCRKQLQPDTENAAEDSRV